jgi:hypothetical protein
VVEQELQLSHFSCQKREKITEGGVLSQGLFLLDLRIAVGYYGLRDTYGSGFSLTISSLLRFSRGGP